MGKPLENDDLYGKVLKCLKVPKLSLFSVLFLTETYFCLGAMNHEFYELSQWIGSRENWNRKAKHISKIFSGNIYGALQIFFTQTNPLKV